MEDRAMVMQGKLTNRYHRKIRCFVYSQTGSGSYVIDPGHWIYSGQWTNSDKYLVVYDYHTWELYGCRIIRPYNDHWYDCVPSAPQHPNPPIDSGTEHFPNGGSGGGDEDSSGAGQNQNP
jgi:hypothetical protein